MAVALALDDGASRLTSRSVAAVLVWWALLLAVAFSFWPRDRLPRVSLVCGGLFAAFAAFAGLSTLWAPAAERAFVEFDRAALYLALLAVTCLATRRGEAGRWADGLALAIAVVGVLALGQRLLPGVFPEGDIPTLLPAAGTRLSYPLGYWNALAIFLALGLPLLLRVAAGPGSALVRAAAVTPLPALAAAVYLTSSRGGVAAALVGVLVFIACTPRRFAVLQALAVAAIGALVAIAVVRGHPALVDGAPGSAAEDEGTGVAALVLLICLVTGAAQAALASLMPPRLALPRGLAVAGAVVAVIAGVGFLAAADPAERIRDFKAPPPSSTQEEDFVNSHLFSGGGSGRWQFWSAATDQFSEHPLAGQGAGTYEAWWAQHGTIDWFVRNAHSLWLETLGELGIIGLLLLTGAFAAGLAAGVGRLRGPDATVIAALLGVLAAFIVGAGIDWIWQVPAVAAVGVVALGLLVGPATLTGPARPGRRGFGTRAAIVLVAWLAILAQAVPMLVANEIEASQDAVARGDLLRAEERAASARSIQPWAASPRLQLALVREELGDLPGARRHLAEAIERDPDDWRLRLVGARLATKDGDIKAARAALREARRLNPRSPALRIPSAG